MFEPEDDPFPETVYAPLATNEGLEAGAVRAAIRRPDLVLEQAFVPERDMTCPAFIGIARAALDAHARGERWNSRFLFSIDGVPWADAVGAYLRFDLDRYSENDADAVMTARKLTSWRSLRERILRMAVACESQDMPTVLAELEEINRITARPKLRIARAA